MKTIGHSRVGTAFGAIALALAASLPGLPLAAQWSPQGVLAGVPVTEDCERTAQAPARAAEGPQVFVCSASAATIDAEVAQASHFFLVHEYGHIAIDGATESQADCWAAHELGMAPGGAEFVGATASWLEARSEEVVEPYGPSGERARRIRECSGLPFPPAPVGDACCTPVGSCALPGSDSAQPIGSGCDCGGEAAESETEEGALVPGQVCASEGSSEAEP